MLFYDPYHKFAGRGWGLATAENTVESMLARASKQPESDGSGISL